MEGWWGSSVALGAFNAVADRVATRTQARLQDGTGLDLTDSELVELRNCYLEHMALQTRSETLWRLEKSDPRGELVFSVLRAVYYVVTFAAACVILYRFA